MVVVVLVFVDSFSNSLSRGHTNKTWEIGILLFYVLEQNKTDVRGYWVYLFTIVLHFSHVMAKTEST